MKTVLEYFKPTIEYTNAEQRAAAAKKFFTEILKIDKVEILKNLTKIETLAKLKEIQTDAIQFDKDNEDSQVVNSVFINWIGFYLHPTNHQFMNQLDIDRMIFPPIFQLT